MWYPKRGWFCLLGTAYTSFLQYSHIFFPTFLQLHGEELQFLHPLLQLVLSRGGHRIHLLVTPVVVFVGVGVEHLEGRRKELMEVSAHIQIEPLVPIIEMQMFPPPQQRDSGCSVSKGNFVPNCLNKTQDLQSFTFWQEPSLLWWYQWFLCRRSSWIWMGVNESVCVPNPYMIYTTKLTTRWRIRAFMTKPRLEALICPLTNRKRSEFRWPGCTVASIFLWVVWPS